MNASSSSAPNKRKRIDDAPEPPVPVASTTRSDIWFEDGNVVIQAETTQYKIYRGALAASSPIFRDMFGMPQPPSQGEVTVEGCPVVHLSDTAADVTIVFQALFLRGHVVAGGPLPIETVAAFLRLGKKYEIELLHAEALKRLRYEYPTTLDDLPMPTGHKFNRRTQNTMIFTEVDGDGPHVAVAHLAREQRLHSTLPLALYWCCIDYSAEGLVEMVTRDAATTVLSKSDLIKCLTVQSSLSRIQYITTLAWIHAPQSKYLDCKSQNACAAARKRILDNLYLPYVDFVALDSWSDFESAWNVDDEMCISCLAIAEGMHYDGRVKFWEGLPAMFGLPGWDELRKE
ncbi:hypothetical protein FIBSPDRAFT_817787 [Athelia psychrophila]|uniref:BTB domain-containing protein n=1 Tax=Athelia psychrophila TaxID=1759441 RepID=A0A166RES0_9AGAM|nr:hypothetical protein FIBSPDRAFT_817787 [Fibularhizoctonia sp. CBS 109695]